MGPKDYGRNIVQFFFNLFIMNARRKVYEKISEQSF